jgi:dephospho-CoA kinase
MSKIIGLTGGIGSGKSIVAKVFANMGVPVFDADATAKHIMNSNEKIKEKLIATFGADVYITTNEIDNKSNLIENESNVFGTASNRFVLNKAYLSKIVFSDPYQLALLNSIVHPITIQAAMDWANNQNTPYVIKEAALFFESGSSHGVYKIIGVSAPKSLRIHRVMKRDQCSKEEVEKRMLNQIDESLKMKLCDWVIVNDDQQLLLPQLVALHEKILSSL